MNSNNKDNINILNGATALEQFYQPDELPEHFFEYKQLSCLKHSKNCCVYLVEKNNIKYILKKNSDDSCDILMKEYDLLKTFNFSFLPKVFDFYQTENENWLLREYIEGHTLYNIVETCGTYTKSIAINSTIKVIDLIIEMHSQNPPIIHRDIKPQNIVIMPNGQYKIIDIGSARNYNHEKDCDTIYSGTAATAAPEQFGYAQTDERTDIYALGMLILFLVTGNFDRDNINNIKISNEIKKIIIKCIEFDPEKRYQSAKELKTALLKLSKKMAPDEISDINNRQNYKVLKIAEIVLLFVITVGIFGHLFILINTQRNQPDTEKFEKPVEFIEPIIERAVRLALGYSEKRYIFTEDLTAVTALNIIGNEILPPEETKFPYPIPYDDEERERIRGTISDLSDLSMLSNLKYLKLDAQRIEDISPLAGLPLEFISLQLNPLSDFTPLNKCEYIETLWIGHTLVKDLSFMRDLSHLDFLSLANNKYINTFEPIQGLNITNLNMLYTSKKSYEPIVTLPLQWINVSNLSVDELYTICSIQSLTTMNINHSIINDFKPFINSPNLQIIHFFECKINSTEGISELNKVNILGIANTDITDISPLAEMPMLETLILSNTGHDAPVSDFSPLFNMPSLKEVHVSGEQAKRIYSISQNPPFEIYILN